MAQISNELLAALVVLALSVLILAGVVATLRSLKGLRGLEGIKDDVQKVAARVDFIEKATRDDAARSRSESAGQAQQLRLELLSQLQGFQSSLSDSFKHAEESQRGQSLQFGQRLDTGVMTIDRKVDSVALTVRQSVEDVKASNATSREQLHALIDAKLSEGFKAAQESQAALRTEIQVTLTALGDQNRNTLEVLAREQKQRLEALSQEVNAQSQRQREDHANLRKELTGSFSELGAQLRGASEVQAKQQREKLEEVAKILGDLTSKLQEAQDKMRKELTGSVSELGAQLRVASENQAKQQREKLEEVAKILSDLTSKLQEAQDKMRKELTGSVSELGAQLRVASEIQAKQQREKLEEVAKVLGDLTTRQQEAQDKMRATLELRLDQLRNDNAEKLERIRHTVDEQLQGTLEKRLGESFKQVSDRLEQVHKGLGEMQSLASGVGDLKRVLTNVKTRGTWGEVQLGGLLEQVLTPDQYLRDAQTRTGSSERVEYAIRLPGRGDGSEEVLLPIDAKFPQEDYERLLQAADRADADAVEMAGRQLEMRIRSSAKDIRDKYINPPQTTDFAILFLPTEGLYAEVLRRPGLVDQIQRDCRVTLSGPTTLAATLNALQMGFRTLAIQKRSSEVWQVLEAVKTEFGKYGEVMQRVQKKLQEASNTVEQVATRSRAIGRKLRGVSSLPEAEAAGLLGLESEAEVPEDDTSIA